MKSPRKSKNSDKPAAAPARAKKGANLVDPDTQRLFLVHIDAYAKAKKRKDDAGNAMRTLEKTIKGDGFTLAQIKDAILMSTPEGEAQVKKEIADRLLAAQYIAADIGEQLGLFMDLPRVPGVDRAGKEGQMDASAGKAAHPKYDPSTEQYRAYMAAYADEQSRMVLKGINKLDAKKAAANKAAGNGAPATGKKRGRPAKEKPGPNAKPPAGSERSLIKKADKDKKAAERASKPSGGIPDNPPSSGVAMTRSQVLAAEAAKRQKVKDDAESFFTKSAPAGNA